MTFVIPLSSGEWSCLGAVMNPTGDAIASHENNYTENVI
jgi:hypothetical protein